MGTMEISFSLTLIFIYTTFPQVSTGSLGGDYFVSIDRIDNRPELSREYADWHLFVKRVNKKDRTIDGYFVIKKDIINPKIVLTPYILSNNKFYKMAVNELVPTSLCDDFIYKSFIKPYFNGNSTFASSKSCVIHTGYMQFKPDQNRDFDFLAHKIVNKTLYGTYKVDARVVNKDNKVVGGTTWTLTTKKRE